MKNARLALLIAVACTAVNADQSTYDDCILTHLKGAKSDVAAHLIKQACQVNYLRSGFVANTERAYNDCLLQHLVGVESTQAAMSIRSACSSKHR